MDRVKKLTFFFIWNLFRRERIYFRNERIVVKGAFFIESETSKGAGVKLIKDASNE